MMHIKGAKKLIDLPMLSAAEYEKVVRDFNNTAVDYPKEKTVHQLFEEQVEKTPDKTAVIACDKTLTYSELNEQANRIAHGLIEKGVGIGDIVALMLPRRSYLIAAMFGVLKAGAAYMPIDPDYPQDRVEYMLNDSNAAFCVTEDNISELLNSSNSGNPGVVISSESICYCIYTSGSTGKPKGTLITHIGMANFCHNNDNMYQCRMIGIGETVIATSQIFFDVFAFEILLSILNGLKVVFANEEEIFDGNLLAKLILKYHADVLHITPSKLQMYCSFNSFCKALSKIKIIMVGGEIFTPRLYELIRRYTSAIIYNGYGPSETTIGVSFVELSSDKVPKSAPLLLGDIKAIPPNEYNKVIHEFNNTAVDYPREKTVHQLFEEQVKKTPDKTAVIACDKTLTYSELNEQANRIAHSLIERGIKNGDIVAFILPRRSYLIATMFGILKAGAAYMPIDPDYPQDRVEYMLNDSNAAFCVTEDNISELLNSSNPENPGVVVSSESICYCIYTSGSTGKPKGTVLIHRGVTNFCTCCERNNLQYHIFHYCHCVLACGSITFDISNFEIVLSLLLSKSVVFASETEVCNPDELSRLIQKYSIDCIHCTPTKLSAYIDNANFARSILNVKTFMVGGEVLTQHILAAIHAYSNAVVFNGYGPTETTMGVSFGEITFVSNNSRSYSITPPPPENYQTQY